MKPRIEFTYDSRKNVTNIYVWIGSVIQDRLEMPDQLSSYQKKKIRKELIKREEE